jgi:hypothetical protein
MSLRIDFIGVKVIFPGNRIAAYSKHNPQNPRYSVWRHDLLRWLEVQRKE